MDEGIEETIRELRAMRQDVYRASTDRIVIPKTELVQLFDIAIDLADWVQELTADEGNV